MRYIDCHDYAALTGDSESCAELPAAIGLAETVIDAHTLYGFVGQDTSSLPDIVRLRLKQATAYQAQFIIQQGGLSAVNDADHGRVSLGKYSYSSEATGRAGNGASSETLPLAPTVRTIMPFLIACVRGMQQ